MRGTDLKGRYLCAVVLVTLAFVISISGCIKQQINSEEKNTFSEPEFVIAKLITIISGDFDPAAGYYEGKVILSDIKTGEEYSIFACSKSWDWVKKDSCYRFSPEKVNENEERHKYSAELSGCYVGILEQVSC